MAFSLYACEPELERCEQFFPDLESVIPTPESMPRKLQGSGRRSFEETVEFDYSRIVNGKADVVKGVHIGRFAEYHWFCALIKNQQDEWQARRYIEHFRNPPKLTTLKIISLRRESFVGLNR